MAAKASPGQTTAPGTVEQRQGDRRRLSWRTVVYGAIHARRTEPRRDHDHSGYFCDRYDRRSFMLATSILCMCLLDSFFTLHLLSHGAVEANPLMNYLIQIDIRLFTSIKALLTGLCLIVLFSLLNFRIGRIRGRQMLDMVAGTYCLLMYWETGLLLTEPALIL